MKEFVLCAIMMMLIKLLCMINCLDVKLDKLIKLNTPEMVQLTVPDKPLLEGEDE